ncbi:Aldo/keto reductase [Teratosphaeria nubilosa]|uniref:Aldo/keto reductase n=1 Tax=Teratosphaeria nubilosa TaxID=161662 RepID=A0A6G1LAD9_9PEZI|nr:Aldo/keto reductase [Teratosphaeria nubilosa]
MAETGIKNVFGGGQITEGRGFPNVEAVKEALDILEKHNVRNVDTASLYGKSEEFLGQAGVGKRFIVDTKAKAGFVEGASKAANVLADAENSKKMLQCTVDVYYLHAPSPDIPFEETLEAINEIHKSGFFKRFGLSNFKAEDVQKVHDIAKAKGYPLPEVYQGNYSAVARKQEELLFPTLRKLGISFYAYSPMAGGFLTKSKQDILDGKGRFDPSTWIGAMYSSMYGKTAILDVLEKWEAIAKEEGVTRADLAYRWVKYHSALKKEHGDAIIVGSSGLQQLNETLESIKKGPLSEKAAKAVDALWEGIKDVAPLDNYHKVSTVSQPVDVKLLIRPLQ